jgi:murein DD-endopeptidase MepM/ murein hydrolase activator NlpD
MKHLFVYGLLLLVFTSCKNEVGTVNESVAITEELKPKIDSISTIDYYNLLKNNETYISNGFDFPVGKPDAKGYYNAQKFGENMHLGDDWNGLGGGDSDLGDSIYAISNGYIEEAKDYDGGWGNVISIVHLYNKAKF